MFDPTNPVDLVVFILGKLLIVVAGFLIGYNMRKK